MNERLFKISQQLVDEYNTRDPFKIAKLKGYSVKLLNLKKQKGFCTNIFNNYFIFINNNLSEQMQRMTCAHELGHILIHRDQLRTDSNGRFRKIIEMELFDITSTMEYEANLFAANLLIDTKEMMDYLQQGFDVVSTASSMNVNVNMIALKLAEINGNDINIPFVVKRHFLGKIADRADSI